MAETIKERVWSGDHVRLPEDPAEFLAFWEEKFALIPEEYRGAALVSIEAEDYSIFATVSYLRPETHIEERTRLDEHALIAAHEKRRDLDTLARLKAEYE